MRFSKKKNTRSWPHEGNANLPEQTISDLTKRVNLIPSKAFRQKAPIKKVLRKRTCAENLKL